MIPVLAFFVLQCTLCLTIRVPVEWDNNSEVKKPQLGVQNELQIETSPTQDVQEKQKPIPNEYFEYTAKKPQFAVDIAAFHGVKSPQNHYKAYPVRPYNGVKKPSFGKHNIIDDKSHMFAPYRQFVKNTEHMGYVTPVSNNYNVYHPYKAEEPALKAIYQDPVLDKIRYDLINTKNRLQTYENNAGEPNIQKEEYLENPKETDRKKFPHKNVPTQFEKHRPQRRPVYYIHPTTYNRDHILNKKIKHPWSQNYAKITPSHYQPIKKQLLRLRQQHAMKYDDEHNEYPQIQPSSEYEEKPDGYDIYEKGREKFSQLRNNVDESINSAVKENHPSTNQNLELQNTEDENKNIDEDEVFSPVKNYAQVRKIETIKHLPREAAFQDAETYDDLQNAPRLREAIKSSKAQTVYSEEGYEDTAYDHAGEQKHASDHEGHGGFLKEKEFSEGKYKIPSFTGNYEDAKGTSYKDNIVHGEKWKNKDKENEEQTESDDYSEAEEEYLIKSNFRNDPSTEETNENVKAEYVTNNDNIQHANSQHDLNKREANFKTPEIDYSSTYLNAEDILNISKSKIQESKTNNLSEKYPYYKKSNKIINKDSPLRYAENLKYIPKKTNGGTEFYDSRTQYVCPDVDDTVDPVPEKVKEGEHPDENNNKRKDESRNMDDKPRLKNLGDKIDCFKAKYFGENPLDSPFFEEDLISKPEPVTQPLLETFKLFNAHSNQSVLPFSIVDATQDILSSKKYVKELSKNKTRDTLLEIDNLQNDNLIKTNDMELVKVRKKRATTFIYEPYKIIRDSQIQDSKKTTTTSNISPLIKQLQSSRVVERVATNLNKDQPVKRNTGALTYKNIGKKDREKVQDLFKTEMLNSTFIDVNEGSRQSEPRYEHRPVNHKPSHTSVDNKMTMSHENFTNKTENDNKNNTKIPTTEKKNTPRLLLGGDRHFFDVTKYLPETLELQKPEPSNKIKKIIERKSDPKETIPSESQENREIDEEYDEYEDEEEEEVPLTTSTTTTTTKPLRRKRIRIITTTKKPETEDHNDDTGSKLRLVTRFRHPLVTTHKPRKVEETPPLNKKKFKHDDDTSVPIYREKKKETSKSTLVTDTTSYDEGDDDLKREDIDKLIGIKHDMDEYLPSYEKEEERKEKLLDKAQSLVDKKDVREKENESHKNNEYHKNNENTQDEKGVDHDDDDDDDDNDSHDDKNDSDDHDNDNDDNGEDDDDDEEDVNDEDDFSIEDVNESNENTEDEREVTTPEPIKRTLPKTTDAPKTTTVSHKLRPIISKKKTEIHQELPTKNNLTQFKQDIREIEIIKEIPKKTLHPSVEVLQLYKDENLAKEVNNIFDVEVFKDDVDLERGPRHGGNYKKIEDDDMPNPTLLDVSKKDTISSESESTEITNLNSRRTRNRENIKLKNNVQNTRRNRGQRAKSEDIRYPSSATSIQSMHGGMLKVKDVPEKKSSKLIELSEDNVDNEEETENMHGGNFKAYSDTSNNRNSMHGGNYRSARITQPKEAKKETPQKVHRRVEENSKNMRRNSAALLDSFARAVPVLTTTPAYILDPSKRMYYYVDS